MENNDFSIMSFVDWIGDGISSIGETLASAGDAVASWVGFDDDAVSGFFGIEQSSGSSEDYFGGVQTKGLLAEEMAKSDMPAEKQMDKPEQPSMEKEGGLVSDAMGDGWKLKLLGGLATGVASAWSSEQDRKNRIELEKLRGEEDRKSFKEKYDLEMDAKKKRWEGFQMPKSNFIAKR